jgi:hypothetical protein
MLFASSPDRFTWTTRTLASFGVGGNALGRMAVDTTTGRVVLVNQPLPASDGKAEFSTSLVDGSDWPPTLAVVTHGFTSNVRMSLKWVAATGTISGVVATSGLFIFTVGSTSGGSKVYISPNGSAWTLVCTLASATIIKVEAVGQLLLGAVWSNSMAFSLDFGATWKRTDFTMGTDNWSGAQCLAANGAQFLAIGDANVWPSLRVGRGFDALT